jgi:hypothetical protein
MSGIIEIIDGVDRSKIFGRVLWNDINHPASALTLGAAAPDSISILGAGGIKGLGFDGNATEETVHGSAEILHGYLEGSDIYFHVHWMPTTANAGNVKWQLEYSWQNVDGTFANPTIIDVIDAASGTAWSHQLAAFAVFRDPGDAADTYGDDAALIQVGIHYQIDVYGSRSQIAK